MKSTSLLYCRLSVCICDFVEVLNCEGRDDGLMESHVGYYVGTWTSTICSDELMYDAEVLFEPALGAGVAKIRSTTFGRMGYLPWWSIQYLMAPVGSFFRYEAIVRDKSCSRYLPKLVAVRRLNEEHKLVRTKRIFSKTVKPKVASIAFREA